MNRRQFIIGMPLALSACSAEQVWAPDDVVSRAIYRGTGPKSLTLYTMKNIRSGNGAHSALMIDASQRVMFDPAGSWEQARMPERNDVLFGVTPELEQYYVSFHARVTYYVLGQRIEVSPDVAERAFDLAMQAGPVPQANCTRTTSKLIGALPGFESVRRTWFPNNLSDDFGKLPGVTEREYREEDADDKRVAARQINAAITAGQ